EYLDAGCRGELADPSYALDEMRGTAVAQVVAVHAGDDDVAQPQGGDRPREVERLVRIERVGPAMADVAERAAAGAVGAHGHERGGARADGLADVRAVRPLADGVQAVRAQGPLDLVEAAVHAGRTHADPFGLAQRLGRRLHLDRDAGRLGRRLLLGVRVQRRAVRFGGQAHGSVRRGSGSPIIADPGTASAPRPRRRKRASSSPAAATLRTTPWLRMSVTASPGMPQGSMRPKGSRSIATFRASPW